MAIGDALGGFAGGLASGLQAREKGGSIVDRFRKLFGSNQDTQAAAAARKPLTGDQEGPVIPTDVQRYPIMDKGGRIKKTGLYRMKKGEVVIPVGLVSRIEKMGKGRKVGRKASRAGRR